MSRFTRPLLGVFLAAALAAPARAADLDPLLPAETESVAVVNVRQVLDSDLIKKFALGQIKQALAGGDAQKELKQLGLDPLKDVTKLTVGMWGKSADDMKVAFVARGKFDPAKLFAAAEDAAKKENADLAIIDEGKVKLVKITGKDMKKPLFVSVADEQTIIGGTDKGVVGGMVGVAQGTPKVVVGKDLVALADKVDGKASLFITGSANGKSGELPPNFSIPGIDPDKLKGQIKNLENATIVLRVTDEVNLDIGIGMKNDEAADDFGDTINQLVGTAKTFLPLMAQQKPEFKAVADDLSKSLKSKVKGKDVTITLKVTSDSISRAAGGE